MSLHRQRFFVLLGVLFATSSQAPSARAQQLLTISVTGAVEETRGFETRYKEPGTGAGWTIIGSAVRVYRPTEPAGPITIHVELPTSQVRSGTGLTGDQYLSLSDPFSSTTIVSDSGSADEVLTIDYELLAPVVTNNFGSSGIRVGEFRQVL